MTATTGVSAAPYTRLEDARGLLAALCATAFMSTLMYGSLSPFFSEFESDLNTSTPALGQVVTLRLLLSAVLALIAGPVADRYGYRRLIVSGMVALALSFLIVSGTQSYQMLLLSGIPGGIAGGVLSGLPLGLAANTFTGEARLKAISYTVAALSSSAIVGIPALTTASAWVGWRGVFFASAMISLVVTIFVFLALPDDRHREDEARISLLAVVTAYRSLFADSTMARLFGSTFFRSIGWLGFLTYMGAYLADEVGFSTRQIGLVYMVGGAGYFIGSLVAGRRPQAGSVAVIAAIMTMLTGAMVLLAMTASSVPWLVVLGVTGITLTSSIAWVLFTTLLSSATPAGQGTTMSLNSTVVSLGSAGGGVVGGVLIAAAGYGVLAIGLATVLTISGALLLSIPRHEHK